jgi:hypothetical protein
MWGVQCQDLRERLAILLAARPSVTHSGQHSARQIRAQPRSVTVLLLAEPTRRPREREHVG